VLNDGFALFNYLAHKWGGMKSTCLLVLLFGLLLKSFAGDTVLVYKDRRLDALTAKQAAFNAQALKTNPNGQYKGYRVQLIATNSRADAYRAKAVFLQHFPEGRSYISYQSPNFRVRVGNFLGRQDAEEFKIALNKIFIEGVDIVEDAIEVAP